MHHLPINDDFTRLAKRYIWWESPLWATHHPIFFLAQVMNLGSWDDILLLQRLVSKKTLQDVLKAAPPGVFNQRSWDYWHARLHMDPVPPLPKRTLQ